MAGANGGTGGEIFSLALGLFSADGRRIMTTSDDGAARIWEVSAGKQLQTVSEPTG